MEERIAAVSRSTKETDITVQLNLDGRGQYEVSTGIGFFDHMLEGFARHGLFDLKVTCKGDLQVDSHHTIEDVGIVLGEAIRQALGEKIRMKFCKRLDRGVFIAAADCLDQRIFGLIPCFDHVDVVKGLFGYP